MAKTSKVQILVRWRPLNHGHIVIGRSGQFKMNWPTCLWSDRSEYRIACATFLHALVRVTFPVRNVWDVWRPPSVAAACNVQHSCNRQDSKDHQHVTPHLSVTLIQRASANAKVTEAIIAGMQSQHNTNVANKVEPRVDRGRYLVVVTSAVYCPCKGQGSNPWWQA